MAEVHDTAGKALEINLSRGRYGTFAEIGGGQEVSRWFFRVGGAAGTVAKTMSAYDMKVGDAIYGTAERYVSRDRLVSMLEREYSLLVERLAEARGKETAFFVFADTVATRSYKGDNESHGWLGLRFQAKPGDPPSDILLHIALREPSAQRQQESIGVLGVNLLHAAFYSGASRESLMKPLLEGLSLDQVEIDVIELHGPAVKGPHEVPAVAIDLVSLGLSRAVVIDESGKMDQPSTVLRKRAILLLRSRAGSDQATAARVLKVGAARLAAELGPDARPPLPLIEVSLHRAEGAQPAAGTTQTIRAMCQPGRAMMVTSFEHPYRLTDFFRRATDQPLRYLIGLDGAVFALWEGCYHEAGAGMLEALGRLLVEGSRIEVFGMERATLERRLAGMKVSREFWSAPDKPVLSLGDIKLASPAGRLLEYLVEAKWIGPADESRPGRG